VPVPGTADQVRQLARLVGDVLGPETVGAYLHGSLVLGGPKPASDVDVLVVSRQSLDDRRRRSLLDGLRAISAGSAAGGVRPVELVVVVQTEVRPWRFPPTRDFLYGEWLRHQYDDGLIPQPRPDPDLALLVAMARAGGRPLIGPPPEQVLDPVPEADLAAACVTGLPGLLDDLAGDTRNVVLTLARIWTTLATGEIRSKDAAAGWALARLPPEHRPGVREAPVPHRPVLRRDLERRAGGSGTPARRRRARRDRPPAAPLRRPDDGGTPASTSAPVRRAACGARGRV
jgi:predicted nucleotidyltransferase